MPRENAHTIHFLYTHHHFAEHFSSRTLCAFRLLKFLKNFKIFSARKFTKFHKLSRNTHHLLIIIFGALASIEKIFWFVHICFWIQKKETIKISFLAFRPPSDFARTHKAEFISSHYLAPSARAIFSLTPAEVSICEHIITFARTYFQKNN